MLSSVRRGGPKECKPRARWRNGTLGLAVTLALVACGKSASFDGTTFRGQGVAFKIAKAPPSWRRMDAAKGLLAFRDEASHATILVNGRCGEDGDDVPLQALMGHLFLRFTERVTDEEEIMAFDGREALRMVLSAKLDGVPKRFSALVFKKDGCVYDMVLIAAPDTFASVRPDFDRFVQSFHTETR